VDGQRLATSSYDGSVQIWDVSDPEQPIVVQRLQHRRLVNSSTWNPSVRTLLASASADKTVAVWSVPDQGDATLVNVLARHTDDINSVAWMPDGERLICVSEDGRATMWDALTGELLGEVSSHAAHCMMVAVNRDGLVATVGEDGMVAVRHPDSEGDGRARHYESSIEGCAWSRGGDLLAVARDDGAVDLLTAELEHVRTVQVSSSAARAVDWAEDDRSFVVGAYDGSLHTFDLDGNRLHTYHDDRVWPRSVATRNGLLAAGSFWSGPHLLELASAAVLAQPQAPGHGPNALALSGDRMLAGTDSGLVLVTDTATGSGGEGPQRLGDGPILSLVANGDTVFGGTYSGHVIRSHGDDTVASEQLGAPVPSLVLVGDRLIAGTYNGELIALDPVTLAVLDRWTAHGGSVKSLAGLGDEFLSAATDRTIAIGSFRERTVLWQHGNLVNSVASLGDQVVASASRDHTVKVGRVSRDDSGGWRLKEVRTLLGPDESVKCVALLGDPSAPLVLAGSYDFGLYVWPVDWSETSSSLVHGEALDIFSQGVSCMAQIDADRVAVAGWDGQIVVVRRAGPKRVEVLWSRLVTDLADAELVGA
jgi:WD40 repeat protein